MFYEFTSPICFTDVLCSATKAPTTTTTPALRMTYGVQVGKLYRQQSHEYSHQPFRTTLFELLMILKWFMAARDNKSGNAPHMVGGPQFARVNVPNGLSPGSATWTDDSCKF